MTTGDVASTRDDVASTGTPKSQIPPLLGAVLIVYVGQMTLSPIIAPLSRRLGMPEWQLGVTISAAAGVQGLLAGTVFFLLFVLLRGIGFGAAIAAVPPTAQAYVAEFTPEGPARVKGMAGIGAVPGEVRCKESPVSSRRSWVEPWPSSCPSPSGRRRCCCASVRWSEPSGSW